MKNFRTAFAVFIAVLLASIFPIDMKAQDIKLPTPTFTDGMPVNEAFARRHSTCEFDSSDTLGQLLFITVP